jgi:hypothetical protein
MGHLSNQIAEKFENQKHCKNTNLPFFLLFWPKVRSIDEGLLLLSYCLVVTLALVFTDLKAPRPIFLSFYSQLCELPCFVGFTEVFETKLKRNFIVYLKNKGALFKKLLVITTSPNQT